MSRSSVHFLFKQTIDLTGSDPNPTPHLSRSLMKLGQLQVGASQLLWEAQRCGERLLGPEAGASEGPQGGLRHFEAMVEQMSMFEETC